MQEIMKKYAGKVLSEITLMVVEMKENFDAMPGDWLADTAGEAVDLPEGRHYLVTKADADLIRAAGGVVYDNFIGKLSVWSMQGEPFPES